MAETPSSYKRFAQSDKISQGTTNAALSLNDYLPGQHVTGPNNNDIAATLAQVQAIPIGTATLSGNTYNVTISNYPNTATIYPGQKISVKFNADAPTADDTALNLSAFGQSLPLCARGVRMGQGAIKSGMILELVYRGDMWNADYDVVKANRGNNGYTTFADGSIIYNDKIVVRKYTYSKYLKITLNNFIANSLGSINILFAGRGSTELIVIGSGTYNNISVKKTSNFIEDYLTPNVYIKNTTENYPIYIDNGGGLSANVVIFDQNVNIASINAVDTVPSDYLAV